MTKLDQILFRFLLLFLGGWFFTTVVVDFVAVPNVFRTVSNLQEAGNVGIKVFTTYNILEFVFGIGICAFLWKLPVQKNKLLWGSRVLSIILVGLILFYMLHLNPNIIKYAGQMHEIGIGNEDYEAIEAKHRFYHHLYVKLDGFKLISLLFLQIVSVVSWRKNETGEEL